MARVVMGLRVEEGTAAKLETLARLMSERGAGVEVTPSSAARAALERGVAVLLAELAETKRARKPAPKGAR